MELTERLSTLSSFEFCSTHWVATCEKQENGKWEANWSFVGLKYDGDRPTWAEQRYVANTPDEALSVALEARFGTRGAAREAQQS